MMGLTLRYCWCCQSYVTHGENRTLSARSEIRVDFQLRPALSGSVDQILLVGTGWHAIDLSRKFDLYEQRIVT